MICRLTRSRLAGVVVLAALAAHSPTAIAQPAAALPADLAVVHPDALGFVHVRFAEVWHHKAMANMRMIVAKAGPKALAALDDQFVPKPSTAERVTTVILPPDPNGGEPEFIVALRFTEPFDQAKVVQSYCPKAEPMEAGGKKFFAEKRGPVGVYFPDDRTIVVGGGKTLESYLTWAPKADGGLAPIVALARDGKSPVVAAVNVAAMPLPPGIEEQIPPDLRPLVRTRLVVATMDLADRVTLTMKMTYTDPDAAAEAERALGAAAQMGRSALAMPKAEAERLLYERKPNRSGEKPAAGPRPIEELPEAIAAVAALGAIAYADELLADLPVTRNGSDLVASITLPEWTTQYFGSMAMSAGLALPAIQQARLAALRAQAMNNMKQIGLAMHNYHDTFGAFPPAAITDKKTGKPLLSWRVAILPFIEQDNLYRQFKLDEPWDSEHNIKLSRTVVKVYEDPRGEAAPGMTYYKVFTSPDGKKQAAITPFSTTGKGRKFFNITDGTSNTIMVVSGGDPVNWAKPDDIPFDSGKAVAGPQPTVR